MFRITSCFLASALLSVFSLFFTSTVFAQVDTLRTEGEEVIVTGFPAEEGVTPIPMEEIKLKKIEEFPADVQPTKVAAYTPSTTFYSQSGTDIGYTFLTIRGFEQRRLSILINGVPQNDPEDHNVYWFNLPDLLGNSGRIQIQRGAGSAFYGPPAIGGSINIETEFPLNKYLSLTNGYGSYNTLTHTIEGATGLFADNWMIYGRLTRQTSDGYRHHSFTETHSYHLSIRRVDEDHTLQANFFGAPIYDGLAYYGIYSNLTDPEKRKMNWSEPFTYERRPEEVERFFQPHYEIISNYTINPMVQLNNTVFYVQGDGEFDFDGTWVFPFTGYTHARYYRLTKPYADVYGFTPINDTVSTLGNELVRAFVGNKQLGWLPRLDINLGYGKIYIGAELRTHSSIHWGHLLSADMMPSDLPADYHFYEYHGQKDIFSPYAASTFTLDEGLTLFTSVQVVAQRYKLYDEEPFFVDTVLAVNRGVDPGWHSNEFEVPFLFVNPRMGFGLELSEGLGAFVSGAITSREPRLKDYYNAEFFSEPNFFKTPSGRFDFNNPLVRPERLLDLEAGLNLKQIELGKNASIRGGLNVFYMDFTDELVKTGNKDRFGSDIIANAEKTEHYGVELSTDIVVMKGLAIELNAAQSKHRFISFPNYADSIDLSGNVPIGFPDFTASGIVSFQPIEQVRVTLLGRYVGATYGDLANSETYRNPDYFVADAIVTLRLPVQPFKFIEVKLQGNNILNRTYTSYADAGSGFFVAAPMHFFASLSLGI